jgi:hypothetical protein
MDQLGGALFYNQEDTIDGIIFRTFREYRKVEYG